LLAAGAILAGLLGAVLDDDPGREARQPRGTTQTTEPRTTETQTTETQVTGPRTSLAEAKALNDEGFALMQQGNFTAARPLLARAVERLRGTGDIYEAYASYNLAYTRFQLGECGGILALLDRSEAIQGERTAIDALRRDWDQRCAAGGDDEDGGKGQGRGGGKGNDD
jgi:tetratricopeptide (TPR) repeat protein